MNKTLQTGLSILFGTATTSLAMALPSGELTTNGGFEDGDTGSWVSFPTATSTFDVTMDANSGSFAGRINNTDMAAGAIVKQANIGIGSVQPGDAVRISFAAKGNFAAGGVAFAEFFSELAAGGTSSNEILGGGPLALSNDWRTFCFTTVAGPDVSGGVTLQFACVTGGAMGSTAELFIDDASVQIGELTINGDFEIGDTSEWVSFPTATSTFDATMDANSGMFAGEVLNVDAASSAVIKQANRGIGVVNSGDVINISFAAKGDFAVGGVAFAEFFSEIAGGGVSSSELLGGAPLPLTADWETYTFTAIAGPDVSGGITLQFATVTGGAMGSSANLFVDDVSISSASGTVLSYCTTTPNSAGAGALMSSSGSPSVSAQDFALEVSGLPSQTFCLFVVGTESVFVPGFDGVRCVGSACRLNLPINATPAGTVSFALPDSVYTNANCAVPVVGTTFTYQCLYRDTGPTGGNWSDALCVMFGE